jgi:hypothetical protein
MSSHIEYDDSEIPYESFYNIGTYMFQRCNELSANMDLVLCELVALHQCRTNNSSYFEKNELCSNDVGSDNNSDNSIDNSIDKSRVNSSDKSSDKSIKITSLHDCKKIKSINSDICSLCSDDTDNTVFRYYISDDEINIE